jgi:hypothetical protein
MLTAPARIKFSDPAVTLKGEPRASVSFEGMKTLWFNTGTQCNIACAHCYIESSPQNDRLVYLTLPEIVPFLDELDAAGESPIEIGFTGGEPFMAPETPVMIEAALARGHRVLVLTNAMQPMMRPRVQSALRALRADHAERLTLRVSLDHYTGALHDQERGAGAFERAREGIAWLAREGFRVSIAGRTVWGEDEPQARAGYGALLRSLGVDLDPQDGNRLVLFPEMTAQAEPPEISESCWSILHVSPSDMMCAAQRMVVKRKGAAAPVVLACTLIAYDARFELGATLQESRKPVALNHKWCATFCVLGGGKCSGK